MTVTAQKTLSELIAESKQLEEKFRTEQSEIMAKIRDAANELSGDYKVGNSKPTASPPAAKAAAKKGPGRPPGSKNVAPAAKKGPGRPPGKKNEAPAAEKKGRGRPKSSHENDITLREAIWGILDRESWDQYPERSAADGLQAGEIKKIMDEEGNWVGTGSNVGNQISGCLSGFKKDGKIARGDQRRYYVVAGAELNGPSLDESGNPIE